MIAHMLGARNKVAHGTLAFASVFGRLMLPASSSPRMCWSSVRSTIRWSEIRRREAQCVIPGRVSIRRIWSAAWPHGSEDTRGMMPRLQFTV
jgi:hypothetical protein